MLCPFCTCLVQSFADRFSKLAVTCIFRIEIYGIAVKILFLFVDQKAKDEPKTARFFFFFFTFAYIQVILARFSLLRKALIC